MTRHKKQRLGHETRPRQGGPPQQQGRRARRGEGHDVAAECRFPATGYGTGRERERGKPGEGEQVRSQAPPVQAGSFDVSQGVSEDVGEVFPLVGDELVNYLTDWAPCYDGAARVASASRRAATWGAGG